MAYLDITRYSIFCLQQQRSRPLFLPLQKRSAAICQGMARTDDTAENNKIITSCESEKI